MKKVLLLVMVLCLGLASVAWADQGKVLYKYWDNINGVAIADLLNARDPVDPNIVRYPDHPDSTQLVSPFEAPLDWDDQFGAELSGWLVPAAGGDYTFWIASDDASELWLSTDLDRANVQRIAWVDGWTPSRNFDGQGGQPGGQQKSAPVTLEAGTAYYIMARYKEGGGGDNCAVAWSLGGGLATRSVIGEADPSVIWSNDPRVCSSLTPASPVPLGSVLGWVLPLAGYVQETGAVLDVYFGSDPAALALVIDDGLEVTGYDPGGLAYDTTYYVRVDTTNALDPNGVPGLVEGDLWSFTTVTQWPVITGQPESVQVGEGCTGMFTVTAISGANDDGGALSYQWKKADGTVLAGEESATLVIGIEGGYYCTVTNPQGSVDSEVAVLSIAVHGEQPVNMTVGNEAPLPGEGFSVAGGTYTVSGGGHDIWDGNDDFQFVYIPMSGDGEISARVLSLENPNNPGQGWCKAGVMVRNDLADNSVHAFMAMTTGNGGAWQGRTNNNPNALGNASGLNGGGNPTPRWVKVVRQGNNFTGYTSNDGVTWTAAPGDADGDPMASPQAITMTNPVYVGLAVTSHDSGILVTAKFDDVKAEFSGVKGFGTSWKPRNPSPYAEEWGPDNWVNPEADVVLSWDPAEFGPCGATYDVIWTTDPAVASDPNAPVYATVTDPLATISAADIDYEGEYYWRVDVNYGGDSEQGDVWYVEAIKKFPAVVTEPQNVFAYQGTTVQLRFEVSSDTPVTFAWYKETAGGDVQVATGSDTLTLVNVGLADDAFYHCVATNNAGSVRSASARVEIAQLIGHWTMDTIVDGKLPDSVNTAMWGGHDGVLMYTEPNAPTLGPGVTGAAGDMAIGVNIEAELLQYAVMGSVGISGAKPRTITCWAKAAVDNTLLDGWSTIFGFTSVTSGNNKSFDFNRRGNDLLGYCIHVYGWERNIAAMDDQWHHLAATYDGTTIRWYHNGVFVGEGVRTGLITEDLVHLGKRAHSDQLWRGWVDDARIYNYVLDEIQIATMYTDAVGGSVCAKRPIYDFNDDCDTDLADFAEFMSGWMECNLLPVEACDW